MLVEILLFIDLLVTVQAVWDLRAKKKKQELLSIYRLQFTRLCTEALLLDAHKPRKQPAAVPTWKWGAGGRVTESSIWESSRRVSHAWWPCRAVPALWTQQTSHNVRHLRLPHTSTRTWSMTLLPPHSAWWSRGGWPGCLSLGKVAWHNPGLAVKVPLWGILHERCIFP